jgi:kynurenine formamidase
MSIEIRVNHLGIDYTIDPLQFYDISMPFSAQPNAARAWYIDPVKIEPVRLGDWVGSVKAGGSVNFNNIFFNPHAHGTHTECVGHISKEDFSINNNLKQFFCLATLLTVTPQKRDEDLVIDANLFEEIKKAKTEAIVIRTLPNTLSKLSTNYSNSNPPYITSEAMQLLVDFGIKHLLIDLPSVDKEQDGGALAAHHIFWQYPDDTRLDATITEFVFVDNEIPDGVYLLNLQVAPFENDASPSRPLLFPLQKT